MQGELKNVFGPLVSFRNPITITIKVDKQHQLN